MIALFQSLEIQSFSNVLTALPEAIGLLLLSVGLIAIAGVLRWILSKFDVVETTVENEAR
ncbi:MAG: hypothetical protein JNL64_02895 [Blastocatellia bacterium]|nr:hypothetical protein [Blastocatellia bacterium]